jgi:hypothetical protein
VHGCLTPDAITVPDAADLVAVRPVALSGLGLGWLVRAGELRDDERPYVSPEQLAGAEPDTRSDVYGLASLLLAMLVGEPAAGAGAAGLPQSVASVLEVARSKDPAFRPASIKTFWEELLAALVTVPAPAEPPARPEPPPAKAAAAKAPAAKARRAARTTGSMAIVSPLDGPDPTARRRELGAIDLAFELVPIPAPPLHMRVERTADGFGYGEPADGGAFGSTSGSSFWFGGFDVWTPGGGSAPARFGGFEGGGGHAGGHRRAPIADHPRPGKLAPRPVMQTRLAPMPPMPGYAPPPRNPYASLAHVWLLGIPAVAAALAWLLSSDGALR